MYIYFFIIFSCAIFLSIMLYFELWHFEGIRSRVVDLEYKRTSLKCGKTHWRNSNTASEAVTLLLKVILRPCWE